jgi:hypothetical protein
MKLLQYLSDQKISDESFGGLVGASSHGVRKWKYGERIPRADQMRRIAEITCGAVQPNDFILHADEAAA